MRQPWRRSLAYERKIRGLPSRSRVKECGPVIEEQASDRQGLLRFDPKSQGKPEKFAELCDSRNKCFIP